MRTVIAVCLLLMTSGPAAQQRRGGGGGFTQPEPIAFDDHEGWKIIFDGNSLKDWDGNMDVWRLENGAIVGTSTPEKPSSTTYMIWKGGEPRNFELKLEIKLEGQGLNSGIQYRSAIAPLPQGRGGPNLNPANARWNLKGYQFDFDFVGRYSGQLYEQATGRGIIAWRGQVVRTEPGKKPRLLAMLGDPDELKGYIKVNDWNQVHLIARGNEMVHIINGHVMSIFIDDDPTMAAAQGVIVLQIEGTGKVSFRSIWLKNL